MSTLKSNMTSVNGVRTRFNYFLIVSLPVGKIRVSLPDTKNNKSLAKKLQIKANEIETLAKLYPNEKDWYKELYIAVGQGHKLPDYNAVIPTIKQVFQDMIDEKLLYKVIKKENTLNLYKDSRDLMIDVIGNIPVNLISVMHRPKLEREFRSRGWSDTTINMRSRYIMTTLKWCVKHNYIDKVPFEIKQIEVPKKDKSWITPAIFNTICLFGKVEYIAYWKVAYHTGLRLRELNTNPDDKKYNGLYHTIKRVNNLWQLDVRGKQHKRGLGVLPDEFKGTYDLMVANRRNPNNVSREFKKACRLAGFGHYRFHDIRHSYISNLSLQGHDAHTIQLLSRHSNLSTTSGYLNDITLGWEKIRDSRLKYD